MVVINVKSIDVNKENKDTLWNKCFHFWGEKHPMCLICLFISFLLLMSIGISQYFKNN